MFLADGIQADSQEEAKAMKKDQDRFNTDKETYEQLQAQDNQSLEVVEINASLEAPRIVHRMST